MDRKKALTLAGAAAISVVAVSTAMAVNLGLLRTAEDPAGDVGTLTAEGASFLVPDTTLAPAAAPPSTIVVDEYIVEGGPVGAPTAGLSPAVGAAASDDGTPGEGPGPDVGDEDGDDPAIGTAPSGDFDDDDADELEDDDDELEDEDDDEDEDEDEHEDEEEHEYEGADDDD